MIRLFSIYTTFFFLLNLSSAEKGKAWEAWQTFSKAVITQDYNAAVKLTSGTWVNDYKFTQHHLSLLAWELYKNPVKFINEFKKGDDYILVLKSWKNPISLTFSDVEGRLTISKWVFAEIAPGDVDQQVDPKVSTVKIKLADIRQNLREIGKAYSQYFKKRRVGVYPHIDELETQAKHWIYIDPETGSRQKILPIAPGHGRTNSPNYPLAITTSTIEGQYYALFDNGEVRAFHKGYYPVILENFIYSLKADKKQEKLILNLGNSDSEIRKQTREKIEKAGYSIAPVLRSYIDNEDPEISMTVRDILKDLKVENQFRHKIYELEKVPRYLTVGLGKYFIVETEKYYLAIKFLKHTRPFEKYKKIEMFGTEYELTAFSKDGKKLNSIKGEVNEDPKRTSSMKYIGYDFNFIHWEKGDNIYFDAHTLAIAKTGCSDLTRVDVTSKEYAWLKKKKKPTKVSGSGPVIDIIINPDHYSYQGNKRSLDEMERTLAGLGAAMGSDVTIRIRVNPESIQKMVDLLVFRMLKHHLINFKIEEYKPEAKKETNRPKGGPILIPVQIENVKEK